MIRLILLFIFAFSGLYSSTSEAGDEGDAGQVEEGSKVKVEVVGVSPGLESIPKYVVILKVTNTGDSACEVKRYVLIWDGGEKVVEAKFQVEVEQTVERRAHLSDQWGGLVTEEEAKRRVATMRVEVTCEAE